MSKIPAAIHLLPIVVILILQSFIPGLGQDMTARFKISTGDQPTAEVGVKFATGRDSKNLWFMERFAGVSGLLTNRFSSIDFRDKQGFLIARRTFKEFDGFSTANVGDIWYIVKLKPLSGGAAAGHVSWVNEDRGFLMLDDLVPQGTNKRANVAIDLPVGWTLSSSEAQNSSGEFDVQDVERSVFVIGRDLRKVKSRQVPSLQLSLNGKWHFSDEEAIEIAGSIQREYVSTFGDLGDRSTHVAISKFPGDLPPGNWEADTRGRTISILSSDTAFRSQSLQRLHEQLRHEMFHLWIPEGVNLTGNYDWFYEGFALYQSLKLGVAVNRLRFEDYLDSLSQAWGLDKRLGGTASLIDVSNVRWSGDYNSVVYARGMLVAFLSDLAMLGASKGKRSTDDIVREVYQKHSGTAAKQDGNAAVIAIMKQRPELVPIIERYVTGSETLDWTPFLTAAGLEATGPNRTALTTVAKPNSRQKKLLDKLGYNNWRKLSSTHK